MQEGDTRLIDALIDAAQHGRADEMAALLADERAREMEDPFRVPRPCQINMLGLIGAARQGRAADVVAWAGDGWAADQSEHMRKPYTAITDYFLSM